MPTSHSKCLTPPAKSQCVQSAEALSRFKAFVRANNELQNLSQQLMEANQREMQLHGTLKMVRANQS